jgi:hypothetical protein
MRSGLSASARSRALVVGLALAVMLTTPSVAAAAPSRAAKVDLQVSITDAPDPVTEGGRLPTRSR